MLLTDAQWRGIKKSYADWWDGTLGRPLLPLIVTGCDPRRPEPSAPLLSQSSCHDLSVPADALIDRIDYELSKNIYLEEAFPYFSMDCFGPGVLAAILGARLDNSTGNVWFFPPEEGDVTTLSFTLDPENVWLGRLRDIYRAAYRRWGDGVILGMADLGGVLDVLSTFVGADRLLMELYDHPEDVKRLILELHELWHRVYAELDAERGGIGYSDWMGAYSASPCYILQSDFAYMIGPDMFAEFAAPEIEASCRRLEHSFYHLDGIGQIPHLERLLSIGELNGLQWVPGDGKPDQACWPEIYQKISRAGKLTHIFSGLHAVREIYRQTGTLRGVFHSPLRIRPEEEKSARTEIERLRAL